MDPVALALGELKGTVAGLSQKVDALVESLAGHREDVERRIRALEIWRGWLTGGMAVLGALASFLAYRVFK